MIPEEAYKHMKCGATRLVSQTQNTELMRSWSHIFVETDPTRSMTYCYMKQTGDCTSIAWYTAMEKSIFAQHQKPHPNFFFILFYPDGISTSSQQWKMFRYLGVIGIKMWTKKTTKQSILSPCCCVNLLMLVYCKLYWCVSLVNCTELVLVNTGFYFVFWAKSANLSNRRKKQWNKIMMKWKLHSSSCWTSQTFHLQVQG